MSKNGSIGFLYDDGGRSESGFKGKTGDCFVRALAIAAKISYRTAYDLTNQFCKEEKPSKARRGISAARTGVHAVTAREILESIGWAWKPTMKIGSGCRVHLREDELPSGRLICRLSKHYVAVIDGVVHDTYQDARDGTRCVYGYWYR